MKKIDGSVNFSKKVIENIVKISLKDIDGVQGLCDSCKLKSKVLKLKTSSPSIVILKKDDMLSISVHICMYYGYKIKGVCEQVQAKVKESIQNITSILVSSVNVFVCSVISEDIILDYPEGESEQESYDYYRQDKIEAFDDN